MSETQSEQTGPNEYETIVARLNALHTVAAFLHLVIRDFDLSSDVVCLNTANEMRDVLSGINEELFSILDGVAAPVWGELPEYVQKACGLAGIPPDYNSIEF